MMTSEILNIDAGDATLKIELTENGKFKITIGYMRHDPIDEVIESSSTVDVEVYIANFCRSALDGFGS